MFLLNIPQPLCFCKFLYLDLKFKVFYRVPQKVFSQDIGEVLKNLKLKKKKKSLQKLGDTFKKNVSKFGKNLKQNSANRMRNVKCQIHGRVEK